MANLDIRLKARAKNVPLWRLAEAIGVSEPTLYRMLRHELAPAKKKELLDAIKKLASKKG